MCFACGICFTPPPVFSTRVATDKWIIYGLQSCQLLFNVTIFSRNASLWNRYYYYSTEEEKTKRKSSCTSKTFTYFFLFISLVKFVYEWLQAVYVRDIAAKLVNTLFIQHEFFYLAADTSVVCSMFIFMKYSSRSFFRRFHNAFKNPNHRMKIKDENVFKWFIMETITECVVTTSDVIMMSIIARNVDGSNRRNERNKGAITILYEMKV